MEENNNPSNLSHRKWVDLLASYFTTIKEYEDKIESLRISLNQQEKFNPKLLFNHVDYKSCNYLSLDNLSKFLHDNSIPFEEKYLRQVIHNYDKDNDFCLNFSEFKQMIIPLTDETYQKKDENNQKEEIKIEHDNKIENKDEKNENENNIKEEIKDGNEENKKYEKNEVVEKEEISPNIIGIFGNILEEEMELAAKCLDISKKCVACKHFTFYESFIEIADEEQYITEDNLSNFLKRNNIELNKNDIKGIIHRLDSDNDGKISFAEFKFIFFSVNDNLIPIPSYKNKYENKYPHFNDSPSSLNYNYSTYLKRDNNSNFIPNVRNRNLSFGNYKGKKYNNNLDDKFNEGKKYYRCPLRYVHLHNCCYCPFGTFITYF